MATREFKLTRTDTNNMIPNPDWWHLFCILIIIAFQPKLKQIFVILSCQSNYETNNFSYKINKLRLLIEEMIS